MPRKRIAVVGANSYIARNLIHLLRRQPETYELFLYDLGETQADGFGPYVRTDILQEESVRKINFDCDILYLFAGKTGSADGFQDFDTFLKVNEYGLLNLLREYVNRKSRAKIVFPSTRLVYKGRPGKLGEDAGKEFKTIYAMNKFACENYLQMYHRVFGVQYCIFRICVPYGTLTAGASSYGTAGFMLGRARKGEAISLYGRGEMRRTLTYIEDLCCYLTEGALSERCSNDVFNIGGEDYSLREMAEAIARQFGVGIEYREWPDISYRIESGDTVFDASKLEGILGKRYQMTFQQWCESQGKGSV